MTSRKKEFLIKASAPSDAEVLKYISKEPDQCLQFRNDDGSIDLDGVKNHMMQARKNEILDIYKKDIGKLNGKTDKRYYIRLSDPTRSEGRYTIKAGTKEALLERIYLWHLENVEKIKEPTIANMYPEFLEHKKATTWSESTVRKNCSIWRVHYEGTEIINKPIRQIRLKDLQEWAYGLIKSHDLTKKEFGNVSTWMKQMFEYALQEEIIERNPYQFLKITNPNVFRHIEEKASENLVLSTDEELAFYQKCWESFENKHFPVHQLLPLAMISLFQLGLRPSEVCCLKYSDIEGDEIVIKRYFSEKGNKIIENRTKAGHGFKRVILTSLEQDLIQIAKQHQKDAGIIDSEYIFMMTDGFLSFYQSMRKSFPKMCEDAGIPRNTPYSGRRTFISSLIDAQVNMKTIQQYVGHKDPRTTLRNYCFDRNTKETRAKQLEDARLPFATIETLNLYPAVPNL